MYKVRGSSTPKRKNIFVFSGENNCTREIFIFRVNNFLPCEIIISLEKYQHFFSGNNIYSFVRMLGRLAAV